MKTPRHHSHAHLKRSLLPVLGLLGFAALGLSSAAAQTPFNVLTDNFDSYTTGSLVGQGGWTQTGTTVTNPIQVTNTAGAGAVSLTTSGQDAYKAFTLSVPHTEGNSLTTSFSLNLSAAQTTGDYFAHLSSPAGTTSNFYERIFAKSTAGGYLLGLSDTGNTPVYGTTVLSFGALTLVNVVWNFVPGALNDTFALTVDGAAYSTFTWTSTTAEPANLAAFNLRQGTAGNAPTVAAFDSLSVDSSAVVPEPTTWLGGVLLVGLAGWSQRRRLHTAFAL